MIKKTICLVLLLCIICLVSSNKLLIERENKDLYATWLKINAMEESLEQPEGAKELLDAESALLETGEIFKRVVQLCEEEDSYKQSDAFAEAFTARNRAILNYIEALKAYEQSAKFQEYEILLKNSQGLYKEPRTT